MSYQVLARKWRPRAFPEMVGQEHVLRALINALDNDRLHHAFLFTGTRGVGKTTVARILAKSLNCEQGVGSRPCGECAACREIDEGRFVDLIEVDAASRTKVEDTRELLENVQYAPTRGRYKVYLVDEVHMLSNHSFNALLKTLEEPPPHVKFLLATTDPQKLPVTILSRCLQFNLKRLPPGLIQGHLEHLLREEGIEAEPGALAELARAADGSMRDALSLLDQGIAFGGGRLAEAEVREMLGTIERGRIFALLNDLASGDGAALLATAAALDEQAPEYPGVLAELASALHRVALEQAVPGAGESEGSSDGEAIRALAGRLEPEDVQLFYQIALIGRRDLPLAPDPRSGFEMVLLRMLAFRPAQGDGARSGVSGDTSARRAAAPAPPRAAPVTAESPANATPTGAAAAATLKTVLSQSAPATSEPDTSPTAAGAKATSTGAAATVNSRPLPSQSAPATIESDISPVAAEAPLPVPPEPASDSSPSDPESWVALVKRLPLAGIVRQLALQCVQVARDGDAFRLALDPVNNHFLNAERQEALRRVLEEYIGRPVKLVIDLRVSEGVTPAKARERDRQARQRRAEQAIDDDPNVQSMLETFDAVIDSGSIRPLGNDE